MDDNKEIIEKLQDTFNQATECMKCRKDRSILRDVCKQVMGAFEKLQKQGDIYKPTPQMLAEGDCEGNCKDCKGKKFCYGLEEEN